MLFTELTLAIG